MTIDGTYGVTGTTLIDGGTAAFDGDASSASAAISVGVLTGPGSFTVSNAMTWTGGTMSGPAHDRGVRARWPSPAMNRC